MDQVYLILQNCGDGSVTLYYSRDEEFVDALWNEETDVQLHKLYELNNDEVEAMFGDDVIELTWDNYQEYL